MATLVSTGVIAAAPSPPPPQPEITSRALSARVSRKLVFFIFTTKAAFCDAAGSWKVRARCQYALRGRGISAELTVDNQTLRFKEVFVSHDQAKIKRVDNAKIII